MTEPSTIAAVAFDLDGLMVNTEELFVHVGTQMINRRGFELDAELLRQMMGRPSRVSLPLMIDWYGLSDTVEALEQEAGQIFSGLLEARLAPMPGLLNLIRHLDECRIPKAITTSSRRAFVERVLEITELPTEFDFILSAEDVTRGKPDPQIYQLAAKRFGVRPEHMLVLEDSEHGCRAAVTAQAFVVAVPGDHSVGHCYDGVDLVADSLADERIRAALSPTQVWDDRPNE